MKKHILILLLLAVCFSSCLTRKYGCGNSTGWWNPDYKNPKESPIRGNGIVHSIDSFHAVIRIQGILIAEDTIPTPTRFLVVYGSFNRMLKSYEGKRVFFESKAITQLLSREVVDVYTGCVDKVNYVSNDGSIVFQQL